MIDVDFIMPCPIVLILILLEVTQIGPRRQEQLEESHVLILILLEVTQITKFDEERQGLEVS